MKTNLYRSACPRVLLNVPRSSVCIIILSLRVYNNYYSIFRNKTLSHHCFLSTNNGFPTIIVLRRSVVNINVAVIEWLLSCPSVRLTRGIMVGPYLYIYAPADYNLRVYGACIWMRLRFTTQRIDDRVPSSDNNKMTSVFAVFVKMGIIACNELYETLRTIRLCDNRITYVRGDS